MSFPDEKKSRFWELVDAEVNGTISEEEHRELESLLLHDEEAQQFYADYCRLHVDLRFRMRSHKAGAATIDALRSALLQSEEKTEPSAVVIKVNPASLLRRNKRFDSIHPQRHKIRFNAMTAVLTTFAWAGFSYFVWFSTTPGDTRPNPQGEDFNFVAYISGVYEHRWAEEMRAMAPNSSMAAGERLQLVEGLIEITFFDGAKVVLEAPTEFIVDSRGAGTLEVGKITASVPERAVGFVIDTPEATITDLGTEFCVEVAQSGSVEVHVLVGSVESRLALRGGGHGNPMRIAADHAIRIPAGAHRVEHISPERRRFAAAGVFVPNLIFDTTVTIDTTNGLHVNRVIGSLSEANNTFHDEIFSTHTTGPQQSYATISNADLLAAVVATLGPAPVGEEYQITSATFFTGTAADGYTATDVGVYATTTYDPTTLTFNNQPQVGGMLTTTAISFGRVSGNTTSWDVSDGVNAVDNTYLFWETGSGSEYTKIGDGNPGDVHLVVDASIIPIPESPPDAEEGGP